MKKYLACLLLLTLLSVKVYGHGGGSEHFMWTTINTFGLYDSKNNKFLPSFDINTSFIFINGGLGYKNITYIDSKNLSGYAGLGIGSFIQLQTGFSKDGFSLRLRSDMQLGYIFGKKDSWKNLNKFWSGFLGNITVSPSIEKYFKNSQMNWYFGIGIGFSINNMYPYYVMF
ncbi:MAG: hypothetical protein FWH36_01940 [Lentimicrobiaceae bacterium]|nr:hypothetical protein [Lentimicrobiaceae bacterium]